MTRVVYIDHDGVRTEIDATDGDSVMESAVKAGVSGIIGECGGSLSCSTCHVYVDPDWAGKLPAADELEDDMLEGTASDRTPTSRLSCQIIVEPGLSGLVVELPEDQV